MKLGGGSEDEDGEGRETQIFLEPHIPGEKKIRSDAPGVREEIGGIGPKEGTREGQADTTVSRVPHQQRRSARGFEGGKERSMSRPTRTTTYDRHAVPIFEVYV